MIDVMVDEENPDLVGWAEGAAGVIPILWGNPDNLYIDEVPQ